MLFKKKVEIYDGKLLTLSAQARSLVQVKHLVGIMNRKIVTDSCAWVWLVTVVRQDLPTWAAGIVQASCVLETNTAVTVTEVADSVNAPPLNCNINSSLQEV